MGRQVNLQLVMGAAEAEVIRDAARRAHLKPSQYALDRLCRVAAYEIAMQSEQTATPTDLDAEAEADALVMLQGAGERVQRWRARKPKRPEPPIG
jgi:hypothetical protein